MRSKSLEFCVPVYVHPSVCLLVWLYNSVFSLWLSAFLSTRLSVRETNSQIFPVCLYAFLSTRPSVRETKSQICLSFSSVFLSVR